MTSSNGSPTTGAQSADRRRGRQIACRVLLLDDTVEVFYVPTRSTGQLLHNAVVQKLGLLESDYFDLQFVDSSKRLVWLDREKSILRQVPRHKLDFHFVVKFYTPDPGLLEDELTRYLFALQVKRDLATGALPCHEHTAILLASYIVQAEHGDFVEDECGPGYLKDLKLLPQHNDEIDARIMGHHRDHFGQTPADADVGLLDIARKLEHYGIRTYPAKDHEGVQLHLSVAHMGILVFQNQIKINTFSWAKIRKLSFKRKKFLIKLHPEGYGFYKDTVEFYFDARDACKSFWKFCLENHAFFRCHVIKRVPRHRPFISRGSSFRYSGRTQKQLTDYVRDNYIKRPPIPRSTSTRTVSLNRSTGASPRMGTLNSHDMRLSQTTNMSSGSHIITSSPPPSARQDGVDGPTRYFSPPDYNAYAAPKHPVGLRTSATRDLVEQNGRVATTAEMPPTRSPTTVNRVPVNGESATGGLDPLCFQLSRERNVSSPVFLVSSSELHSPVSSSAEAKHSPESKLPRSAEVENIPERLLNVQYAAPLSMMAPRSPGAGGIHHSQSAVPPDRSSYNQNLGYSGDFVTPVVNSRQLESEPPEPPPAYQGATSAARHSLRRPPPGNVETRDAESVAVTGRHHPLPSPSHHGRMVRLNSEGSSNRNQFDSSSGSAMYVKGSANFTSDGSIASSVVAPIDDDQRTKVQKPMNRTYYIAKELLMTERTYKKDLEIINLWFRNAICREDAMSDSLNELLFGLINPIHEFHTNFLKQLEQRLASWEAKSSPVSAGDTRQIGDVLLMLSAVLPRYRNYLDHQEQLLIALDAECKDSRVFDRLYRDFEMQKVCYLPINSFLLKPSQRLLHYQLLLNTVVSFNCAGLLPLYNENHLSDFADCQETLLMIGELTQSYQDRMHSAEMLQKLIELKQDLIGVDDLVQPSREFIREGCLQKLSSKGYQQRMFFLFTDMLVYASRMPTRSLQFKVHGCIQLTNMAIKETDPNVAAANSFSVFAGNRLLVVAASSESEKNKWMEDLELALERSSANKVESSPRVLYPSLKSNSSSEVADEMESEIAADRQIQHRTNTLMHVCWHRNTSVSMAERSIAVRHLLSGYLLRKFKSGSGWQKLWVVFTNFCLFFYKSHQDDFPLASLPLLGYAIQLPSPEDGINKDFVFKLQFKNHVYLFRAESQYTFERWMEVITLATSKSRHLRLFSRLESGNQE